MKWIHFAQGFAGIFLLTIILRLMDMKSDALSQSEMIWMALKAFIVIAVAIVTIVTRLRKRKLG